MGDFGWAFSADKSPAPAPSFISGVKEAFGVSPCALGLSSAAHACLGAQDIWGAPVPLGLSVTAAGLAFALGALLVLAAQALCCSCYVTCRLVLTGASVLRQTDKMRAVPRKRRSLVGLKPGDVVFVNYGVDEEPWHERLILAVVDHCCYIILTPDGDIYAETISLEYLQPVYRFSSRPVGQELQDLFEEGRAKAAEERRTMGILEDEPEPPPASAGAGASGAPPLPPLAGSPPAGSSSELFKWVCVARSAQVSVGNAFMLAAQHHTIGDPVVLYRVEVVEQEVEMIEHFRRLTKKDGDVEGTDTPQVRAPGVSSAEDARTLPVLRDSAGRRFRDMKSVANSSEMCAFDDWVLEGPRTALYLVKEIAKQAAGPLQRHSTWKHENKLQDDEHNAVTREMLSEILELATTFDQLDVSNLASMESLCRHIQYIEQRIKKKREAGKDFDLQDYYLGRTRRTGGALMAPELQKWVAESAARDSSILKVTYSSPEQRRGPRRAAQRLGRKAAIGRRSNDCIAALNNLYGDGSFLPGGRPSQAQFSALDGILRAVTDDMPPDPLPAPEAALQELLGTEALDYASEDLSVVAPYDRGLVSWPDTAGSVNLLDVLPDPDRQEVIDGPRAFLLRAEEGPPATCKVYWDKTLKADRGEYVRFVQDLLNRGMVELRTRRDFEVGIFFARKKSGKLRLIVDARSVNQNLRRPTSIQLASTAAMVGLEAEPGDMLEFSIQDIADCFYQFKVPDYMAQWFGMKPVRAGEVGAKTVQGEPVLAGARVYPCLRVLPMGFSWAMRWTQQAHRELLRRAGLGGIESELVDRQVPPRLAAKKMSNIGLPLHEVEEGKHVVEALGLELDGIKLRCRLASSKRWRLVQGTRALLRRRLVAGREVEKLVGHFTHAMLLNRPTLCIFRSAYDYARKHYRAPSLLWPSVRQELQNAMHIMPLLAVQFDMPRSGLVTCSDATLRGYAVQEADFPVSEVRQVGRWSERWRFKVEGAGRPREPAGLGSGRLQLRWEPTGVRLTERCLRDRARARIAGTGGPTVLEQESATAKTKEDYERRLERFFGFCSINGLALDTDLLLEEALAECMDLLFAQGEPCNSGAKLLAAVGHRWPRLHHAGRLLKLPRVAKALQGWRRLAPPVTRAPVPWAAMAAIALALVRCKQPLAALAVVLAADAYLRPGELLSLRASHVVPAQATAGGGYRFASLVLRPEEELQPTKTRGFNDSTLLDSVSRPYLGVLVERLAKQKGFSAELLFPRSAAAFTAMFKRAAADVGLEAWELTPYILRHAGPSHDWLTKARSLGGIKRRGRWISDMSVRRYEKSSRVMRRLATLPRDCQLLLAESANNLEAGLRFGHVGRFES
ncbi:unnamed protein product, partial [Prorocentrum cordatum]